MVLKEYKIKTKKIVFVGDAECGKSTFIGKYIDKRNTQTFQPTIYDTYSNDMELKDKKYHLSLIDTAGRYEYDRFRILSYDHPDCVVLCFAVDSLESFYNAEDKWALEIQHRCQDIPYILVGMKTDLRTDKNVAEKLRKRRETFVTFDQGLALSRKIKAHAYLECSTVNYSNVKEVIMKALEASKGRWQQRMKKPLLKYCTKTFSGRDYEDSAPPMLLSWSERNAGFNAGHVVQPYVTRITFV